MNGGEESFTLKDRQLEIKVHTRGIDNSIVLEDLSRCRSGVECKGEAAVLDVSTVVWCDNMVLLRVQSIDDR